jgi:hypothetical protein
LRGLPGRRLREHGKPEVLHFARFKNNLAQTKCTKNYKVLVLNRTQRAA